MNKSKKGPADPVAVAHFLSGELDKSKAHCIAGIIEYVPHTVVSKTILRKTTGHITLISLGTGEELPEKISPFDTYLQIIDGTAEVVIDDEITQLKSGDGIIVPAHSRQELHANHSFKMIATVIKSGYET